jgi:hypothetical protein
LVDMAEIGWSIPGCLRHFGEFPFMMLSLPTDGVLRLLVVSEGLIACGLDLRNV